MARTKSNSSVAEKANTALATNLRKLVTDTGALAKYLGCTPQSVNQFKQGTAYPKIENLIKIAEYYNVSVDYLLGIATIPNRDTTVQAVGEYTQLSEKAVLTISNFNLLNTLMTDLLITQPAFKEMLGLLREVIYKTMVQDCIKSIAEQETKDMPPALLSDFFPDSDYFSPDTEIARTPSEYVLGTHQEKLDFAQFLLSRQTNMLCEEAIKTFLSSDSLDDKLKELRELQKESAIEKARWLVKSEQGRFDRIDLESESDHKNDIGG